MRTTSHSDAAGEDDREPGGHRDDGGEVAAIEAALGEPAGDERGERIAHQVAAGRPSRRAAPCGSTGEAANTGRPAMPSAR